MKPGPEEKGRHALSGTSLTKVGRQEEKFRGDGEGPAAEREGSGASMPSYVPASPLPAFKSSSHHHSQNHLSKHRCAFVGVSHLQSKTFNGFLQCTQQNRTPHQIHGLPAQPPTSRPAPLAQPPSLCAMCQLCSAQSFLTWLSSVCWSFSLHIRLVIFYSLFKGQL